MSDPAFITWEELLVIHEESIVQHGGTRGIRDEHLIHSALGAAMNDYFYANADVAGIAAAHAFHIAQAQAFLDGNKRTAIGVALTFLECEGTDTKTSWRKALYDALHAIAERRMAKSELAVLLRTLTCGS